MSTTSHGMSVEHPFLANGRRTVILTEAYDGICCQSLDG